MKVFLSILFASAIAASANATTPLWMRYSTISPNGEEIAFSYKGDIYKVNSEGGQAIRLTSQNSHETMPIWSPDGKSIAFASDRFGNYDIFIMPATGGTAKRLTFNSTAEKPWTFTNDSKSILFSASIFDPAKSALMPTSSMTELYSVNIDDCSIKQILATPAEMVSFSPNSNKMIYQDQKGFEDQWRKHHTSSVTRDIWEYDFATGRHSNITDRAGEDRNPIYFGEFMYFLSERNGGTMNVYHQKVAQNQQAEQVTNFKTHPVRFLSCSSNGTLCFTYDGEIYTMEKGGKPTKVIIDLVSDHDNSPVNINASRGIKSASVSPDGKQVAFVVRGEGFVTSAEYATTKRITTTETGEANVCFAKDNRTIAYAAERNGIWGIYMAKIKREEDLNFANATIVEETRLTPNDGIDRQFPQFSPDGKYLAFIESETKLKVIDIESQKIHQVTDGSLWYDFGFNYSWSPDGKWFALEIIGNGHDPYSDVAIVKADGSTKPVNLTNSGYFSSNPKWVLDGNAVMFVTDRYGMRSHASWGSLEDVMLVFMNQDAFDKYRLNKEDYQLLKDLEKEQKKAKDKETDKEKKSNKEDKDEKTKDIFVEIEGLEDRIVRVTNNSSSIADAIISKDGEKLFYLTSFEKGYDLWKVDLRERKTSLVKKLDASWASLQLDAEGDNLFIFGSNSMQKMSVIGEKLEKISFTAPMVIDLAKEREYMFDHVCRQEARHFYKTDMHGVNWDKMTKAYKRFLPHINNNYDFAELLSEMLGELNVSHTGGRYRPAASGDATANLGLLFDWDYIGNGLKVSEVIIGGPFDHANSDIKSGTIITKINGKEFSNISEYFQLLNKLNGKKTLVSLYNPETSKEWDEVIKPISSAKLNTLLYDRWVKNRAEDVRKWSNGRLGYVHIASMNDNSFRTIYSDILGKYNKCEGIVIDTRFNGGGRLHEDIEVLFSGEKYLTQVYRGKDACDMPSRRWNKPSIMVQCEANYSNAHGTPWVYKYKKIGKLVGAPVPGTMTSVSWETLQDNTLIFGTPIIGYRTAEGNYLENSQLEPDILVLNTPETIVSGEDTQLRTAVTELLKEIDSK